MRRSNVVVITAAWWTIVATALLGLAPADSAQAATSEPWWSLNSTAAPTNLPLKGKAQIAVTATNLGNGTVNASSSHVTLTDELPEGLTPEAVEATASPHGSGRELSCPADPEHPRRIVCTSEKSLAPYDRILLRVSVSTEIAQATAGQLTNTVRIEGGQTRPASLSKHLSVGSETPFGVETYALTPENAPGGQQGGTLDTQAGSHPFQLTTTLDFTQTLAEYSPPATCPAHQSTCILPSAPELPRDLHFKLPAGLVGDPGAAPQCSDTDFSVNAGEGKDACPGDTAIGVATVLINDPLIVGYQSLSVPIFNLVPAPGEPARLGFDVENVPVVLKTAVPVGGEYAVEASISNASQAVQVLSSQVTLWGVPGDPRHDQSRGWECLANGWWEFGREPPVTCDPQNEQSPTAFLTMPTSCERPPATSMGGDSWPTGEAGTVYTLGGPSTEYAMPNALTGCGLLPFDPSISVIPQSTRANTPTGLDVDVDLPQESTLSGAPGALGEAAVKNTTVTLPAGLQLSPSAANGLQVCSALAFGFAGSPVTDQTKNLSFTSGLPACPDASKVGTVAITTPLLEGQSLTGSVYLAEQNTDPFHPPLALYLVAEDPTAGVLVKLAGTVTPTASGQVVTTFENTPQLPFDHLELHFFGGERSPVTTPPKCGSYTAGTSFTGWSGAVRTPSSEPAFQIVSGPGGSSCANPLPFSPSVETGASNEQAGSLTHFTVKVGHADSDQPLERITLHLPAGIAALISQVTPCSEESALEDACGTESQVGHLTAVAGLGNDPVTLGGRVYLTGALKAGGGEPEAPFGLLVVTHAAAGPFDLGDVPVLSRLEVDPNTAAVTVQSERIPEFVDGVPTQLKQLEVTVERPGDQPFEFNPTNCNATSVTGALDGYESASVGVSRSFQVHGCQTLPFTPVLEASTQGQASKANGASLTVKVASAGLGQANIAKVDLQLPITLPTRLTTIQQACVAAVFEANPAACDPGSVIGTAIVHTPILAKPLEGPAYLISHGGAAFPDVEFVLQGEGIKLILDGKTDIKNGITYSRFETVPDAPFTSFETVLPAGPHSALGTNLPAAKNYNLCGTSLAMPITIAAQNGDVIAQTTKIAVTGCKAVAAAKAKKLTRAQKLKKALLSCRKRFKRLHKRRAACEGKARKTYRVKPAKAKPTKTKARHSS